MKKVLWSIFTTNVALVCIGVVAIHNAATLNDRFLRSEQLREANRIVLERNADKVDKIRETQLDRSVTLERLSTKVDLVYDNLIHVKAAPTTKPTTNQSLSNR